MTDLETLAVQALSEVQIDALDGKRVEFFDHSPEASRRLPGGLGPTGKRRTAALARVERARSRGSRNRSSRRGPAERLPLIRKAHQALSACRVVLDHPCYLDDTYNVCAQIAKEHGLTFVELYAAFMRRDLRAFRRRERAESGGGR